MIYYVFFEVGHQTLHPSSAAAPAPQSNFRAYCGPTSQKACWITPLFPITKHGSVEPITPSATRSGPVSWGRERARVGPPVAAGELTWRSRKRVYICRRWERRAAEPLWRLMRRERVTARSGAWPCASWPPLQGEKKGKEKKIKAPQE